MEAIGRLFLIACRAWISENRQSDSVAHPGRPTCVYGKINRSLAGEHLDGGYMMPLYNAHQLLKIRVIEPKPGMPPWANLKAVDHPGRTVEEAELLGPGIYALFLDGALFYIGIHVPQNELVTKRWHKHVVAHTLRAASIFMSRKALLCSLTLPGPVGEGIRACQPAGMVDQIHGLGRDLEPCSNPWLRAVRGAIKKPYSNYPWLLASRSYNTIFNKARFAEAHWDILGPGNEETMLSRITCGYERYEPAEFAPALHMKKHGLKPRELDLIRRFRPICNEETAIGAEKTGIGWPEVQGAILEAFSAPNPYERHDVRMAGKDRRAA